MWLFETEQFKRDVDQYGVRNFVETRSGRISHATTRAQATRIAKPYAGYLVTRHANFRLIGTVEELADREVFVWLRVLKRGDDEYGRFTNYAQNDLPNFLDRAELNTWFRDMVEAEVEAARPTPLPDEFVPWLDPIRPIFAGEDWDDDIVYETMQWVTTMGALPEFRWPEVYHVVLANLGTLTEASDEVVTWRSDSGVGVVAQCTEHKALFLLAVLPQGTTAIETGIQPVPLGPEALRHARRAYPNWLLVEEEMWFDIQKGVAHNLALSPEEQRLLRRVAGQTASRSELPMFINGQAGSGKSTMLAYVFAGLCKQKHLTDAGGRPLFITYNMNLLEKARNTARRILDAPHGFERPFRDVSLDGLFISWRDYLLSLLPEEGRAEFSPDRRVDYLDFTLAWDGHKSKLPRLQVGRGDYPAETVWYAIRSLIKGSDFAGDLNPDDYSVELTRDERTFSEATYRDIYDRYYLPWYAAAFRDLGLWDDQDLTRAALQALDEREMPNEVAALVIDEAQDFTRRELRLITRTTAYCDYHIPRTGNGTRPPIVFAGDPLQTLSPTGFRWGAVKASIFEELRGLFGPEAPQPVFEELLNNYRSAEPIVRLANTIQLWRAVLFDLGDIRPQGAWSPASDVGVPEKFLLEEVDESQFMRFAADTVIVVPCEEGGEIRYVQGDPTLSKMYPNASEKEPPTWVFSAAGIKGLEYEKVVLYKFGEAARGVRWPPERRPDERDLQSEYFFNKLYVAATRATQNVYVADTIAGDGALWVRLERRAVEDLARLAQERGLHEFGEEQLGTVEAGAADLEEVQEKNPRENAVRTRDYAYDTRSSRKMRQAASFFRRANERREADECEAWALRFDGELLEAGRMFARSMRPAEAWRCLWENKAWDDLSSLAAQRPEVSPLELAVVRFMCIETRVVDDLCRFAEEINRATGAIRQDQSWVDAVSRFCREAEHMGAGADSETLRSVVAALDVLVDSGFDAAAAVAVKLYAQVGNKRRALELLAAMRGPMTPERARLYREVLGVPQSLRYLLDAGLAREVRDAWVEAGRPNTPDWMEWVEPTLSGPHFIVERLIMILEGGAVEDAADAFVEFPSWSQPEFNENYVDMVLRIVSRLGSDGRPKEALDFINRVSDLRLGKLSKETIFTQLVLDLVQHYEAAGWLPLPADRRSALQKAASAVYTEVKIANLKPENVPAFGAFFEMARQLDRARRVYIRSAGSSDRRLRNYCRRRFLFCCTEALNEGDLGADERRRVQNDQHDQAQRWGLDLDQRDHERVASLTKASASKKVAAPSAGEIAGVRWEHKHSEQQLVIDIDDDPRNVLVNAKLSLAGAEHRVRGGSFEVSDGGVTVTAGDAYVVDLAWGDPIRLAVQVDGAPAGDVTISLGTESERESSGGPDVSSPSPTGRTGGGRTTPKGAREPGRASGDRGPTVLRKATGQISVRRLAAELKESPQSVKDALVELGFRTRGDNDRLPFNEIMAVRAHFEKMKQGE